MDNRIAAKADTFSHAAEIYSQTNMRFDAFCKTAERLMKNEKLAALQAIQTARAPEGFLTLDFIGRKIRIRPTCDFVIDRGGLLVEDLSAEGEPQFISRISFDALGGQTDVPGGYKGDVNITLETEPDRALLALYIVEQALAFDPWSPERTRQHAPSASNHG